MEARNTRMRYVMLKNYIHAKNDILLIIIFNFSLLKYDWKPIGTAPESKSNSSSQYAEPEKFIENVTNTWSRILSNRSNRPSRNIPRGPCYMGISMPKSLLDIFPSKIQYVPEELSDTNYLADDSMILVLERNIGF